MNSLKDITNLKKIQTGSGIMKSYVLFGVFILLFFVSCSKSSNNFYVSPDGNDDNSGTQSSPFQSIQKAKEAVLQAISDGANNEEITVYLRGGTYFINESVVINEEEFSTGN